MRRFTTADNHFQHANIINYCHRPFHNVDQMNEVMVTQWNMRVNKGDEVYHLGDFSFYGKGQGGLYGKYHWEDQLNGKIIHILGNHDGRNKAPSIIASVVLQFGGFNILAKHIPPETVDDIPEGIDAVISGHVHEKWQHIWLTDDYGLRIPVINVGVDVRSFRPMRMEEVVTEIVRMKQDRKRIQDLADFDKLCVKKIKEIENDRGKKESDTGSL